MILKRARAYSLRAVWSWAIARKSSLAVTPDLAALSSCRRSRPPISWVILALALHALMLSPASAQPLATWTGGGGDANWNDPANWSTGTVPNNNSVLVAMSSPGAFIFTADASITGNLSVGTAGAAGRVVIFDGHSFTRSSGPVEIFVGSGVGTSTLNVSATGSKIFGSGVGFIRVGEIGPAAGVPGTGELIVDSGGSISGAQIFIADVFGSTGSVTVDGKGSNIFVPAKSGQGWVSVGFAGTGTLTIKNGGVVVSEVGALATQATGDATATVEGKGSLWNIYGGTEFHVGGAGNAVLHILKGGQVNAETSPIVIAKAASSFGTVTVDGAGSSLTNTTTLTIADLGNGTLTVSKEGNVTTGTIYISKNGGDGELAIGALDGNPPVAPGTVDAAAIVFGSANGTITFNHTSTNYLFGVPISGPGFVDVDNGTTIFTADNTYTGGTTIEPGATLQLGDGGTTGSIVGSVDSAGTLIFNRSNTYDFNGTISGPGSVAQNGIGTTIFGTEQKYTGTTNINAGTLEVDNKLASLAVNVNAGGTLAGVGDLAGHVVNAGTVAPGKSTGGFGTLTVASYAGLGGTLAIDTQLGDDSSPTDVLKVTGDTSGNTKVKVTNRGGQGALTNLGIEIVDVGGASNGNFTLLGDYNFYGTPAVIGGAYAYTLHKDGKNWYLHSSLEKLAQQGLLPPGIPTTGGIFQPGVALYETYPQILLGLLNLGTLRERVGNRYLGGGTPYAAPAAYADPDMSYVRGPAADYVDARQSIDTHTAWWGQVEGRHARMEPSSSTAGATYRTDQVKLQTGLDAQLYADAGGKLIGGFDVLHGNAWARPRSIWGDGKVEVEGYGFGGTLTWYGLNGFYVDSQARVMLFNTDLRSDLAGPMGDNEDATGVATSVEVGRRFAFAGPWAVTPQAQLSYARVRGDFTDNFGADVSIDDGDSLVGRLGVALDYRSAWLGPRGPNHAVVYGIANVYREFLDGTTVDISGTPFSTENEKLWGGLGLGGTYAWAGDRYALFGEVSVNTSLDNFGDSYSVNGIAGLRIRW